MDNNNSVKRRFLEDEIFKGQISKSHGKPTIKVNYDVPADSVLRVYQSATGHTWDYTQHPISGKNTLEFGVSGSHYYIWFKSGDDGECHLSTYLIESLNDEFTVSVLGMTFDNDGKLLVSGGTGGGTVGDASAQNQLNSNLAVCSRLDASNLVLTNSNLAVCGLLSSIDVSANNMEVVLDNLRFTGDKLQVETISGFSTSAKQDSILSDLDQFKFTGDKLQVETISGFSTSAKQDTQITSLQSIDDKLGTLKTYEAKYNIESAALLQSPGQNPSYSAPPSNLGIPKTEGYYWKNTVAGQASQLYFYSYLNLSGTPAGQTKPFQLQEITNSYAVIRVGNVNFGSSIPFLGIYTRITGTGDFAPGFYKSRRVYTLPAQSLTQSMKVMIWWGISAPDVKLWPGVARVQASLALSNGTQAPTELVAFMSLNSDSAAAVNQVEYVVNGAGFQVGTESYSSVFSGESSTDSTTGDASAANQTTQINIATGSNLAVSTRLDTVSTNITNSNIALCGRLDKNVYTNSNLHVRDDLVLSQLVSSNTVLTNSNLALSSRLNSLITDGIMVKGYNFTGGLQEEIQSINNSLAVVIQNQSNYATSEKQDETNEKLSNIEIDIDNINSKVATELTLSDIKTQTDKLIFNGNSLYTEITNLPTVEINNFPEYALDSTLLLVKGQTDKLTFSGTALEVEVKNSVGITSASPLDVHCFGSSDGIVFHHIKTNNNGVVSTNAIMETDANGALTSTENGTINSLDVHLQNTATTPANCLSYGKDADTNLAVPLKVDEDGILSVNIPTQVKVINDTSTELSVKAKQFGSYANLCNNQTFTPGQASTALNISEFITMAGFYSDTYGGAAPTGSLRIQYSFDNTTWYNIYNTQIFPSGTGTRTATIFNQAVFGLNFVRFLNDTNQTHPSVTITILGSTLQ
jgi:hypothetical protein